ISDTHLWHSDMEDEIRSINARANRDFVFHLGDVTDTGTTKEFLWARNILGKLRAPYVTLLGNHDMLATGRQSFSKMFGKPDFSFIAGRIKFVCVNTNAAEYAHIAAAPDFDFMERETMSRAEDFDRTVVLMHAPPYCEQFDNNVARPFRYYLSRFPNLLFCVYGHMHETTVRYPYDDDLAFYGVGCANKRQYRVFTFTPDGYEKETVSF
ncbi:MAG: metallophosphoesterase, partial [Fibrobacter sp.]|nr:metallophosphoesterase [Fibrobacter sp.]